MDMAEIRFADRSDRGKLQVTGPQAAWFLHQVLTQAFEDMKPGEAREAAMITAHGRMTGYLEALATIDGFLCHFEPALRETLPDALRRYLFATQAEIDDVSDEVGLVLVTGGNWRGAAAAAAPDAPLHETSSLGVAAGYAWVPWAEVASVLEALDAAGHERAAEEELEAVRIANGVARWGTEMDTKTFPQEAGVDSRAVHFDKGCYVGQEAMAKIHFRGKVNRRLARITSEEPLTAGTDLVLEDARVGRVTSASNGQGLAIVKRSVEAGAALKAGSAVATVVE